MLSRISATHINTPTHTDGDYCSRGNGLHHRKKKYLLQQYFHSFLDRSYFVAIWSRARFFFAVCSSIEFLHLFICAHGSGPMCCVNHQFIYGTTKFYERLFFLYDMRFLFAWIARNVLMNNTPHYFMHHTQRTLALAVHTQKSQLNNSLWAFARTQRCILKSWPANRRRRRRSSSSDSDERLCASYSV